ncbi:MAG: hypothetical protein D6744_17935 [Planctomycetota bacterium]|nr:MAG: hypothetical protein D6744_17935 [Planctomycetota bacterium]
MEAYTMRSQVAACAAALLLSVAARSQDEVAVSFDVDALVARFDELAALDLWPGFDPRKTPLAIYDGRRTILLRHPNPPPEFKPRDDGKPGRAMSGRHPAVVANSSAEIGGVTTGTVELPSLRGKSLTEAAAVVLHETFHVYQRTAMPDWSGNIAVLFEYPVDDLDLLTMRRIETVALREALNTGDDEARRWAAAALEARRRRFERLAEQFSTYERAEELNEGLAQYVQMRASGRRYSEIPPDGFAPDAVRLRCYATGNAFGVLLDRFDPDWRVRLTADSKQTLDGLLADAIGDALRQPAEIPQTRLAELRAAAERDIAALRKQRAGHREAFLGADGWRIEIDASAARLWPQGFDPMNVELLRPGEVLHQRFVKLGNDAGAVELHGRPGLTVAAGDHPLYNGVARVLITGLPQEPAVTSEHGRVEYTDDAVEIHFTAASVERSGRVITIRLRGKGD